MSIIGIIVAVVCYFWIVVFNSPADYDAAIGWGVIGIIYLLALSIVTLVKAKKVV